MGSPMESYEKRRRRAAQGSYVRQTGAGRRARHLGTHADIWVPEVCNGWGSQTAEAQLEQAWLMRLSDPQILPGRSRQLTAERR